MGNFRRQHVLLLSFIFVLFLLLYADKRWNNPVESGGHVMILTNGNKQYYADCPSSNSSLSDTVKYTLIDSVNRDKLILYGYEAWDTISRKVKQNGNFEPHIDRVIHFILSRSPTALFLDIGANIGIRSLQVAKKGTTVVAVEALALNTARFCKSIYANGLEKKITIIGNALAEKQKSVSMGKFKNSMGASFVADDKNVMNDRRGSLNGIFNEEIRAITFDDLLYVKPIKKVEKIVIKLDIEGYEAHALKGASEFFRRKDVIGVAMGWRWHRGKESARYIFSFFDSHHFVAYKFDVNGKIKEKLIFGSTKGLNWPEDVVWIRQNYNDMLLVQQL